MSKVMTLMSELIELISMGPFGSDIKVDNFISEGVPVLNGSNVSSIKLIETSFKYVSSEKAKALKKANAKRGDIVITHRGTVGQISYIPDNSMYDNYVISQSQFRVSLKRELVDPIYFTYYFHTDEGQKRLLSFKSHVGVPALAQATTNFRLLEFPLIPLSEQQKIAKVLSDLDTKIELNNRINTELEAMAKTLYDYWFVQFDFPYVTSSGVEKPYKTSGGKMVWNEELKREIPEGWVVQALEQIVEIISGNVSPKNIDTNTPYIGLEHIPRRTIVLSEWETAEKINSDKCLFKKHDILFGKIRPYFHKVGIAFIDGITSTDTIVLRPRYNFYHGFALQTVFADDFVETATNSSTGSKMPRANWSVLKNYAVAIPSKKILETYQLQFNNIIKKIELSVLENKELASLRDWLLPMLMNGQVSVGEVEKELGMVAEESARYGK